MIRWNIEVLPILVLVVNRGRRIAERVSKSSVLMIEW